MNRRRFLLSSTAATALLAGSSVTLVGCNALDELTNWVPVGLAAFDGIVAIVDGPLTAIGTVVDSLWAAVSNAINLYEHSTDPKDTTLDKVIATLDALAGGLSQALAALPVSIPAGVLAAAKAGLALLIATLKSIRNKLQPSPAPATYTTAIVVTPAKNAKDFVKLFNNIMQTNGVALRIK
jgi:hypothetical protein